MQISHLAVMSALAFASQSAAANYNIFFWSSEGCDGNRQQFTGDETTGCNAISNARCIKGGLQDGNGGTPTDYVACAYTNSDCSGYSAGLSTAANSVGGNIYEEGRFWDITSWVVKRGSC